MEKIIVIGSSGHAMVVIDIIEKEQRFEIIGLTDPFKQPETEVLGYKILGGQRDIPQLINKFGINGAIIAIGDNWNRYLVFDEIRQCCPGLKFVNGVHPFSHIGRKVSIGDGSVIMPGAVINNGTKIGRFCIVNTAASIDHECVLEDFSTVAPGATLGGGVKVGKHSTISLGAKVIDKITIAEHVVVGAGAVVIKNIPERVVAYGSPARVIRKRIVGE